jgi:hypothetical protein
MYGAQRQETSAQCQEASAQRQETRDLVKSFEELDAWKKAHELALAVHRVTTGFPREERFGIVAQLRRAASSVPANVAEGLGGGQRRIL